MRLSPKYFRIRPTLLFTPLITLFIIGASMWVAIAWMNEKLNHATLILEEYHFESYIEERALKNKAHTYVDIIVRDQPFCIHLTDEFHAEAWEAIKKYGPGDTIEILYSDQDLGDSLLVNPAELKINGNSIIRIEDTRMEKVCILCGLLFATILGGLVSFLAFRTYRELMWKGDKEIYAQSKWLFVKRWFREK